MPSPSVARKHLSRPADRVVKQLVGAHRQAAQTALERLATGEDDPEILHAFRVAVRRLRATVRAYRDRLGKKSAGHALVRLGRVQQASNVARDVEVQIERIERYAADLSPARRRALVPLLEALRRQRDERYARLHARLEKRFARALRAISVLESSGPGPRKRFARRGREPYAQLAAAQLIDGAAALRDRLGRIRGRDDHVHAHRARIAGKRLRYVLEPVVRRAEAGRAAMQALKTLQTQLGDLHDLALLRETLAERLERAVVAHARLRLEAVRENGAAAIRRPPRRDEENALLEIEALIESEHRRTFEAFAQEWLQDESPALFEHLAAVARTLAGLEAQSVRPASKPPLPAVAAS